MNRRRTFAAVALGAAAAFLATACGSNDSGASTSASAGSTVTTSTAPSGQASTPAAGSTTPSSHASTSANGSTASGSTASSHHVSTSGGSNGSGGSAATGRTTSPTSTTKLADGSTALIYKRGESHYFANVVHDGQSFVTLETTNGHVDGIDANDMFIVLDLDGTIHSWMGGAHQGPGTFTLAGGWKAKVTKVGELHYRAQISGGEGAVATLDAKDGDSGHNAGVNANGAYIVLGNDGQISAHS